jgi:hypothetical protein
MLPFSESGMRAWQPRDCEIAAISAGFLEISL